MDDAAILEQLIKILELIEASGQALSQEEEEELLLLVTEIVQDIYEKQASAAAAPVQPQAPSLPSVNAAEHPSSNIFGFNFEPKSGRLLIKFMGKDTAESGPVYEYGGVPPYIFDLLKRGAVAPKTSGRNKYHSWFRGKTPSHGASVYALIKQAQYPYQKVA